MTNNKTDYLCRRINVSTGRAEADLIIKNANIINVFTESIQKADIAVSDGYIAGIGNYSGKNEIDANGKYVCPGFIDGHIHLESTLVMPSEFEKAVLPHGTTAVVEDPHEIANVAGSQGINFMMKATENLLMDVFFMISSCVPSTKFDESGAVLKAEDLEPFYNDPRVLGLAEFMNAYGLVNCDDECISKISDALTHKKLIDGHAPSLTGKDLNAYIASGVHSDHECSNMGEALEKLALGQWIMIREGTAAKNLQALLGLFEYPYYQRCLLVTDDKHTSDLMTGGHIDDIIRMAVKAGADPIKAIKMGSFNAAQYFRLCDRGAVAPGYIADLVVFEDLSELKVDSVFKNGKLAAKGGKTTACNKYTENVADIKDHDKWKSVYRSFNISPIKDEQLKFQETGRHQRVIDLVEGQLTTKERIVEMKSIPGFAPGVDPDNNIVKLAVFERYHNSSHVGLGFLGNYGLRSGAVATSIGHDSHNLLIAGTSDADIAAAGNCVIENNGGLAVVENGRVVADLPLTVGGLISEFSLEETAERLENMKSVLRNMGISKDIDPFMTLAFVSLPVIPKLRLNSLGLIDVEKLELIRSIF